MRRCHCLFGSRAAIACRRVGDSRHFGSLETRRKIEKSATIGLATFQLPVELDRSASLRLNVEYQIRRRKQMFHKATLPSQFPGLVSTKGQAALATFSTNTTHKIALLFDTKINVSKQCEQTGGSHWSLMARMSAMLTHIYNSQDYKGTLFQMYDRNMRLFMSRIS